MGVGGECRLEVDKDQSDVIVGVSFVTSVLVCHLHCRLCVLCILTHVYVQCMYYVCCVLCQGLL